MHSLTFYRATIPHSSNHAASLAQFSSRVERCLISTEPCVAVGDSNQNGDIKSTRGLFEGGGTAFRPIKVIYFYRTSKSVSIRWNEFSTGPQSPVIANRRPNLIAGSTPASLWTRLPVTWSWISRAQSKSRLRFLRALFHHSKKWHVRFEF